MRANHAAAGSGRRHHVGAIGEFLDELPQQVWAAGTTTEQPADSSNRNAENPMLGRIMSTRQVTSSPTRMTTSSGSRRALATVENDTRASGKTG
jgi:hypothetical protein